LAAAIRRKTITTTRRGTRLIYKYILLVAPLAMLAAVIGGCGGGSKKTVTVGETKYTAGGSVPAGFPKDFPIYGAADFKGYVTSTQQGRSGFAATWETGDSIDKVKTYYNEQLGGKSNWVQDSLTDTGAGSFYSFHRNGGDNKQGFLTVSGTGGTTGFIVFIGDSQNTTSDSTDSAATLTTTGGSSSTATSAGGLPDEVTLSKDFPKDRVPFPSGARVTSTSALASAGANTFFVEIYVKDSPDNVASYFKDELPKHGWTNSLTSNSNGSYFASFAGSDTEAVTLTIEQSDTPGYAKVTISVLTGR
jgi:hypothetical protein